MMSKILAVTSLVGYLANSNFLCNASSLKNVNVQKTLQPHDSSGIKAIAVDMDGTYFNHNGNVTDENLEAWLKAQELGVWIFPATGRGPRDLESGMSDEQLTTLNFKGGPGVYLNGGVVYGRGGESSTPLYVSEIPHWILRHADVIARSLGLELWPQTEDYHFHVSEDSWAYKWHSADSKGIKYMKMESLDALLTATSGPSRRDPHTGQIIIQKAIVMGPRANEKLWMFQAAVSKYCDTPMSRSQLIELLPKGMSKAKGLELIFDELNVSPSQALALGDSDNDLEMMNYCARALCPSNAKPSVKKVAVELPFSNEESFAAKAIQLALGIPFTNQSNPDDQCFEETC